MIIHDNTTAIGAALFIGLIVLGAMTACVEKACGSWENCCRNCWAGVVLIGAIWYFFIEPYFESKSSLGIEE